MITAQDIREKTFEKSKFNGYEMTQVDEFLEELANDVTTAQKENAVLKSKMKVLVEKIEEYRSNEEALNLALMSAQKLAVQIEADARARASEMIAEADRKVNERIGNIEALTTEAEQRQADAEASAKKYIDAIRAVCNAELSKLDSIEAQVVPQAEEETVFEEEPAVEEDEVRIADAFASFADTPADADSTQAFRL